MTKKHEEDLRRGRKLPYTRAEIAVVENELLRLDSRLMRCEMKPKAIYAPDKPVSSYEPVITTSYVGNSTNKKVREEREKIGGM